jgi:hypothetical protein
MNANYSRFLAESNVAEGLRGLATATTLLPTSLWRTPSGVYGFPPVLVPILQTTGPCYYGYWKHWFVSRSATYVEVFPGHPFTVGEYARTAEQFAIRLVLNLIEMNGNGSAAIEQFAATIGVYDYEGLLRYWRVSGEVETELTRLPEFFGQMPRGREGTQPDYDGSFPCWDFADQRAWWTKACSLEIDPVVMENWPAHLPKPEYLTGQNGIQLLKSYVSNGKLDSAWLSLNSAGWEVSEAQDAMELLKSVTDNPSFHLLADAWLEESDKFRSCY